MAKQFSFQFMSQTQSLYLQFNFPFKFSRHLIRGFPFLRKIQTSKLEILIKTIKKMFTQHPIVALAFTAALSRNFDETIVERKIMPDGILPAFLFLIPKVREIF